MFFFGSKFSDFCPKIRFFCHRTLDFVNGSFVALAKTVDLAPSDRFFDFLFPSYGRFREGTRPGWQKVFPNPSEGPPSASITV